MNIRGIKITFQQACALHDIKKRITKELVKGLPLLNGYKWATFDHTEFVAVVTILSTIKEKLFPRVDPEQTIVINYANDVSEFDAITLLSYKGSQIVIDIETKRTKDSASDLEAQVKKHSEEFLPQLFPNLPSIVIGYLGKKAHQSIIFDGKHRIVTNDIPEIIRTTTDCTDFDNVSNALLQVNSIAAIHKIWTDIRAGTFKYYSDTTTAFDDISRLIGTNKIVICYGDAGSGKTVLALKLLHDNPNARMLVLNEKLYAALRMYSDGKVAYGTNYFLSKMELSSDTIGIIDETQRSNIDDIVKIAGKCKCLVIFGDNQQAFMRTDMLFSPIELKTALQTAGIKDVALRAISASRRFDVGVDMALKGLLFDLKKTEKIETKEYRIVFSNNLLWFFAQYERQDGLAKMYTTYSHLPSGELVVNGHPYQIAEREDYTFSISSEKNIIGHTLHAISFDVEHCFVFLPDLHMRKIGSKKVFCCGYPREWTNEDYRKLKNELDILFTRGTKSLTVFFADIEVFCYFNLRLSKITGQPL